MSMHVTPALLWEAVRRLTVRGEASVFVGTIREMVHACLPIDTLLSATPTCSQLFSFVEVRRGYPWLAMLRDRLPTTTAAYQLNRLRTAERPTGLIVYRTAGAA